jgi:hypothetical protein
MPSEPDDFETHISDNLLYTLSSSIINWGWMLLSLNSNWLSIDSGCKGVI